MVVTEHDDTDDPEEAGVFSSSRCSWWLSLNFELFYKGWIMEKDGSVGSCERCILRPS